MTALGFILVGGVILFVSIRSYKKKDERDEP